MTLVKLVFACRPTADNTCRPEEAFRLWRKYRVVNVTNATICGICGYTVDTEKRKQKYLEIYTFLSSVRLNLNIHKLINLSMRSILLSN